MAYIGFTNGTSHHTRNLSSSGWVIYYPIGQLVTSSAASLGKTTNTIFEYSVVIELLGDAILHGI